MTDFDYLLLGAIFGAPVGYLIGLVLYDWLF